MWKGFEPDDEPDDKELDDKEFGGRLVLDENKNPIGVTATPGFMIPLVAIHDRHTIVEKSKEDS